MKAPAPASTVRFFHHSFGANFVANGLFLAGEHVLVLAQPIGVRDGPAVEVTGVAPGGEKEVHLGVMCGPRETGILYDWHAAGF